MSYPQVITCGYIVSTMVPRPCMWITCGEINGDMFGGVEYNDDLYVLDVLSYGWIRGRGK